MLQPIIILLPVYNDSLSLKAVLADINSAFSQAKHPFEIVVVDDGSTEALPEMTGIKLIHLTRNLGHQKAIAIGLAYIKDNYAGCTCIVMDSDGEDRVQDIPKLLAQNKSTVSAITFATRKRRTNGVWFKFFYWLYKLSFYLSTGKKISFGNFSLIPYPALSKLVYYSEIWNNFPGGVMKSGLAYNDIPTERGMRYAGKSKMNFTALLLHGFGAIAVFLEIIITRVAIFSFLLMLIAAISIAVILSIKTFSNLAIPGWASTLGSSMFIILLVSFIISLIAIFIYLSTQSQRKFIPALHYKDYILNVETIANGK
jgi:polyisoprenyl-phosphate glycosyltransferase